MPQFAEGQQVAITMEFRTIANALSNPTTIELTIKKPDGTDEGVIDKDDMENVSTGLWRYLYTPNAGGGRYRCRVQSTGSPTTVKEKFFDVAESAFV